MPVQLAKLTRSLLRAGLLILLAAIVSGAARPSPASAAAIAAARPGTARIWIYRDYAPYQSLARPYVRINGAITAISEPGGAFYRDVAPGRYDVTVDSIGTDVNQFAHVDLGPGQQVFLKVQSDQFWMSGGGINGWYRDTFYVRPQLPQIGAAEIARTPFYGGG